MPRFDNDRGYYGTNFPMQMSGGRFTIVTTVGHGLYFGTHDLRSNDFPNYLFELQPGYTDSLQARAQAMGFVAGHPAHIAASAVHYVFVESGRTA